MAEADPLHHDEVCLFSSEPVEMLYKYIVPKPRSECSKPEQLVVTFVAGYIGKLTSKGTRRLDTSLETFRHIF